MSAVRDGAVGMPQRELRCPGEDSNLHAHRAQALNLLRMPIPPPGLWSNYSLFITLVNLTNRLIKNLTEKESSTHDRILPKRIRRLMGKYD